MSTSRVSDMIVEGVVVKVKGHDLANWLPISAKSDIVKVPLYNATAIGPGSGNNNPNFTSS